jgi:lipoic acid synthetase
MKPFLEAGELGLHTVCQSAMCPNMGQCFGHGTATFMILGNICTRSCRFCAVTKGSPEPLDPDEANKISLAVKTLKLRHAVITSVTRDDLPDGGAASFARVIRAIHTEKPGTIVEVLVPDFKGNWNDLATVVYAEPEVLNHNVETVPALYQKVRPQAIYQRSLDLLRKAKQLNPELPTKSGLMLGLGETREQVLAVMDDLLTVGCDMLTLGQYLRPTARHLEVVEYIHPEQFDELGQIARARGFRAVAAGPLVRSSWNAGEVFEGMRPSNAP